MLTIYSSPLSDESRFDGSRFFNGALSISAPGCINYIREFIPQIALFADPDESSYRVLLQSDDISRIKNVSICVAMNKGMSS